MRKKRTNIAKKISLLLVVFLAVFLLVLERGYFLKAHGSLREEKTEEWITLGWTLEDLPLLQKKTEIPSSFDGLYTYLFPALSFSICFDEEIFLTEEEEAEKIEETVEEIKQILKKGHGGVDERNKWNWAEYVCKSNSMPASATEPEEAVTEPMENEILPAGLEILRNRKKVLEFDEADYSDMDEMLRHFYIVDPSTSVKASQIEIAKLRAKDMSINLEGEGPQILIYHTHSQEAFADSVVGNPDTTIVGAGEQLAKLLEGYGFRVIHETGEYDVESRSTAYSNIQPVLEQYLAEYPDIQVMIDLHRDEVKEGKLVTEIDGKQMARFMFFNGLSYLNSVGDIAYLANPNIEDNLAFAFQLQYLADQYFPGITRKIYLKGYRYNLHYLPKSLLIELGAQTNTCEEILNACEPLAEVIARVLSGEK